MEESAAPEAPNSEVATTQLRNLGQNFTPSSHRFSAQERPIQYGSEGLDSIEHLKLITSPGFAVSNQKGESERFLALNTRHLRREKFG
jgi:hypothetical protein